MKKIQRILTGSMFVAGQHVRRHEYSGLVEAAGMTIEDLPNQQVRKHSFSGQVDSDGSIQISDGTTDSTPHRSATLVRKMSESIEVDAVGNAQIFLDSGTDVDGTDGLAVVQTKEHVVAEAMAGCLPQVGPMCSDVDVYTLLASAIDVHEVPFMNMGFYDSDQDIASECLASPLMKSDTAARCIDSNRPTNMARIYMKLINDTVDIHRRVLDVGSGRGSGIALLASCFHSREAFGLEANGVQVKAFETYYLGPSNLHFLTGNYTALPFSNNSLDMISGVESVLQDHTSLVDFRRFLEEAHRTLRPGGILAIAGFLDRSQVQSFAIAVEDVFETAAQIENITVGVLAALRLDVPWKRCLLKKYCSGVLQPYTFQMEELMSLPGTRRYALMSQGDLSHLIYRVRKARTHRTER